MAVATSQVQALARAIAGAEGFGVPGALPTRANNPGDITDTGYAGDTGQTLGGGIRVFANAAAGWNALDSKLTSILGGYSSEYPAALTFTEFGAVWSGGDPNWATNVTSNLGIDPSTTLQQFAGGAAPVGDVLTVDVSAPADGSAPGPNLSASVQNAVQNMNPATWIILTAGVVGALFLSNFLFDDD